MWLKHSLIKSVESVGKCIVLINTHVQKTHNNDEIVYLYIDSTFSYQTIIFNFLNVITETYTKYFVIFTIVSNTYSNLAIIWIWKMRSTMWTRTQWWWNNVRGFWFYCLDMFWTIKSNFYGSVICDSQETIFLYTFWKMKSGASGSIVCHTHVYVSSLHVF